MYWFFGGLIVVVVALTVFVVLRRRSGVRLSEDGQRAMRNRSNLPEGKASYMPGVERTIGADAPETRDQQER